MTVNAPLCTEVSPVRFGLLDGKMFMYGKALALTCWSMGGRRWGCGMRLWVVLLLMVSPHSCATVGRAQQSEALALKEARVKARKGRWHATLQQYMDDARVVITQTSLLQGHPGWSDMKRILHARDALGFLAGEKEAHTKTSMALAEWDRKWTASSNDQGP